MWRWQQSGRSRLWTHIIAGCTLAHSIMLCMLFLIYRGSVDNYMIYTSSALTTQQVILLPLHKVVGKTHAVPVSVQTPVAQAVDTQGTVERQTAVHESKATTLASSPKVKTKKNKREKKSKKKSRAKNKKEAKKIEKKKIEQKKVEEQKSIEKPVLAESSVAMSVPADAQSAIYVGQLEYEALQLQEAVQRELQTHWKPPIGHAGLTCVVCVMLDWQGAISDINVEQPSGVLMFDMSAEQAITAMTFPKTAWGKQVTISFS